MPEMLYGIPILDNPRRAGELFLGGGGIMRMGFEENSYAPEMHATPPREMTVFSDDEIRERLKVQWENESGLIHLYLRSNVRDVNQGEWGYCWMAGVINALHLVRLRDGLPYVHLSLHAAAAKIKSYRDEGGWCGLAAKWVSENGVPPSTLWPEGQVNRRFDTPATWDEAKKYAIQDMWYDLSRREWDQNLTLRHIRTQTLQNNPVPADFMAMYHTMCILQSVVHPTTGEILDCVMNSWKGWGNRGLAFLRGSWATPRSAVVPTRMLAI